MPFASEPVTVARDSGWIIVVGTRPGARAANLDGAVAALAEEIQAVVEILAKRHEQDVGAGGIGRQSGFLRTERIADGARIKSGKDRVDGAIACRRVEFTEMRIGDADERLVGGAEVGVGAVVARAFEVTNADGIIVVERLQAVDEVLEAGHIAGGQLEGAGNCITGHGTLPIIGAGHYGGPLPLGDRVVPRIGQTWMKGRVRGTKIARPANQLVEMPSTARKSKTLRVPSGASILIGLRRGCKSTKSHSLRDLGHIRTHTEASCMRPPLVN